MSAITDKARDFWDRISPRERRLVVIAAIATPITIALWLSFAIHDGLVTMEHRNDQSRKALDVLADLRARGQTKEIVDDAVALMGTEPLSLDTYLTNAAKKAKFELKSTITPHPAQTKNGFVTNSSSLSLDKLTIEQLRQFLMEVESGSKVVAVTHIDLRRDFREKDKLSVNLEISTYSRDKANEPSGSGGGAAAAAAGSGGSGKGS